MDNRPIGVFDSGLGGLTAVRELRALLPGEDIVYFGDTGRIPYGTRGNETILQYARQDIRFLLSRDVKYIVAACGTVSSLYPPEEAQQLPVPFLGVVDAAAAAAVQATRNHLIGVIGTPATIRSGSYPRLLHRFLPDAAVWSRACPMFVPLVENGYVRPDDPVTRLIVEEYLTDFSRTSMDTLILGCTHYPLIRPAISAFMGPGVTLIDPGCETAHRVMENLPALGLEAEPGRIGTTRFYVSDSVQNFAAAEDLFMGRYAGGPVEQIAIEKY